MFGLLDSVFKLILVIPVAILLVYIFGAFCHSFFGGPIWLWIIGLLILSALAIREEFNKSKSSSQ